MKTLLLVLAALGASSAAQAYGVDDPGRATCHLFAQMYETGPKGTQYQFLSYAQGYAAARGYTAALAAKPVMGQLVTYCVAHPDAQFTAAVEDLLSTLPKAVADKS